MWQKGANVMNLCVLSIYTAMRRLRMSLHKKSGGCPAVDILGNFEKGQYAYQRRYVLLLN